MIQLRITTASLRTHPGEAFTVEHGKAQAEHETTLEIEDAGPADAKWLERHIGQTLNTLSTHATSPTTAIRMMGATQRGGQYAIELSTLRTGGQIMAAIKQHTDAGLWISNELRKAQTDWIEGHKAAGHEGYEEWKKNDQRLQDSIKAERKSATRELHRMRTALESPLPDSAKALLIIVDETRLCADTRSLQIAEQIVDKPASRETDQALDRLEEIGRRTHQSRTVELTQTLRAYTREHRAQAIPHPAHEYIVAYTHLTSNAARTRHDGPATPQQQNETALHAHDVAARLAPGTTIDQDGTIRFASKGTRYSRWLAEGRAEHAQEPHEEVGEITRIVAIAADRLNIEERPSSAHAIARDTILRRVGQTLRADAEGALRTLHDAAKHAPDGYVDDESLTLSRDLKETSKEAERTWRHRPGTAPATTVPARICAAIERGGFRVPHWRTIYAALRRHETHIKACREEIRPSASPSTQAAQPAGKEKEREKDRTNAMTRSQRWQHYELGEQAPAASPKQSAKRSDRHR